MSVLEDLRATVGVMVGLLSGFDLDKHADLPTPCAGWTGADLVDHICANPLSFLTWAGADAAPPAPGPPVQRYDEVFDRLLRVYGATGMLAASLSTPFGALPGGEVLAVCFADQLTHVWDLARCMDVAVDVPDGLAQRAIEVWQGFLTEDLRDGTTFARPREPGHQANALDRPAAFTGRSR